MSHITPSFGGHSTPVSNPSAEKPHWVTPKSHWVTPEPVPVHGRVAGGGHWTIAEQRAAFMRGYPPLKSRIEQRAKVTFPTTGPLAERIYMQPFLKVGEEILLPSSMARWIPTVATMLQGIETTSRMYLMVDRSVVKAGQSQRRPGPHIDGHWRESGGGTVDAADFEDNELIILASNVEGCVAYVGSYPRVDFKPGGDCSGMNLSKLKKVRLLADYVYVGTVATIHESVPIKQDCFRTLVRINVPGVTL